MKTTKLRQSARGRECQVRLMGICNHNPETTVLAHLNGAGMGLKKADIHAAFACSDCHDALDRRVNYLIDKETLELAHRQGVERTQDIWLQEGLISFA